MSEGALVYNDETKIFSLLTKEDGKCVINPIGDFISTTTFDIIEDQDYVDLTGFDFSNQTIINAYIDGDVVTDTDGIGYSGRMSVANGIAYLTGKPDNTYLNSFVVKYYNFS